MENFLKLISGCTLLFETKEIPSEEGLGIAKSPEGPKLDPHF